MAWYPHYFDHVPFGEMGGDEEVDFLYNVNVAFIHFQNGMFTVLEYNNYSQKTIIIII